MVKGNRTFGSQVSLNDIITIIKYLFCTELKGILKLSNHSGEANKSKGGQLGIMTTWSLWHIESYCTQL